MQKTGVRYTLQILCYVRHIYACFRQTANIYLQKGKQTNAEGEQGEGRRKEGLGNRKRGR